MTDRRYQYAKSTHPDVLDAMRRREEALRAWKERALAWAAQYDAEDARVFNGWGRRSVIGLAARHAPEGWTKPDRRGVSRPKKRTPEYAEMVALAYEEPRIPGLAELHVRRDPFGLSHGVRFVVDGAVYFGLPWVPDQSLGEQWVEVLPSEFERARA